MSISHGRHGKMKLATNEVAHVKTWSVKESIATSDSTSVGDGAETHTTGATNWSGSVDIWYDPDDANGQGALVVGASVVVDFYSQGDASGKKFRRGTATVTDVSESLSMSDNVSHSLTLKGNGELGREEVA